MSKKWYGGGHPRTPWHDSDITPEVPQDQLGREFRAQQEMAPERAPEQRAADARPRVRLSEHEELELKLDCHYEMIQEQSALIVGQRAAIEALRGWIQECADGVSNLGTRVAKLEDGFTKFRARVLAGFPSIGEAEIEMGTPEEQITEIWPETEEDNCG